LDILPAVRRGTGNELDVGRFLVAALSGACRTQPMKGIVMKRINRLAAVAAALWLASAAASGCAVQGGGAPAPQPNSSSALPPPDGAARAADAIITIRNFTFEVPASVRPGAMVTLTNTDSAAHTLTATDKGGFEIEVPGGGTVIFRAPDTPGKYQFICTFHPKMNGTLVVG
jgi:plastocyanin